MGNCAGKELIIERNIENRRSGNRKQQSAQATPRQNKQTPKLRSKPPKPSPPKVKVDLDDPRFPKPPAPTVVAREKTPQITRYLQPSPRASVITDRSSKASSDFKTVDFKVNELAVPHQKNVVDHQVDSPASLDASPMTSVSDDGQARYGSREDSVITPVTPVFPEQNSSTMLDIDSNDDDGDSCTHCPDCIAEHESEIEAEAEDEVSLKVSIEKQDPDLVPLSVVSEPASPCESNLDVIVEAGLEKSLDLDEEVIVEDVIQPITRSFDTEPQINMHTRQESKEIVEQYLEQELKTPVLMHKAPLATASPDEEEIAEETIVPIQKTSADQRIRPQQQQPEPEPVLVRQNSPEFEERPGPKFSSLADVPVVYCDDSDDEDIDRLNVRPVVLTTDDLLAEVRNSVEDISLENIQYEETLSDDTEMDEEDTISTGPSETEADIFSDETESDYPAETSYPTEPSAYRAVDPSMPVSAKTNNHRLVDQLLTDDSEYFTSDSERPADDEGVSKVEELMDQALEEIEENIVSKPISPPPAQVEPSDIESLDDIASQSEVSFAVSESITESHEPVHVFRPATVYKQKAAELTDDVLTKSMIQLQSDMMNPVTRRMKHLSSTTEPLSRDSPIDYSNVHDDPATLAELEAINSEKFSGDFFLKQRFAHLSESVRDSPIDYSQLSHPDDEEMDEEEHMALKAEKDDGEPVDFDDDISIDDLDVTIDDSDDTESKAESIVDELEMAALRRLSRASSASANFHCEHDPFQDGDASFGAASQTKYAETATEESIDEAHSLDIIQAQSMDNTHLEHFEPSSNLCYFDPCWQPEVEQAEQVMFMIVTPSYHENIVFAIAKDEVPYANLAKLEPQYLVREVQTEETFDEEQQAQDIVQTTFLLETPEYQPNQLIVADDSCDIMFLADTNEQAPEIEYELDYEPKETFCVMIETPEYHDNKLLEVSSLDDIDNANIDFCGDSSEDIQLEEDSICDEVQKAPTETEPKLVVMVQTPAYQQNQIVEVDASKLNQIEDAQVDYCQESDEEIQGSDEIVIDSDKLVMCVETPSYHDNQLVQVNADELLAFDEETTVEYCSGQKGLEPSEPEFAQSAKLIMCLETPEYCDNLIVQVAYNDDIEQSIIEYCAACQLTPSDSPTKMTFCIETPSYHDNIEFVANYDESTAFELLDVDFTTGNDEVLDDEENMTEFEMELGNDAAKNKLVLMVETPSYQDNQIVEVESDELINLDAAMVDFCAATDETVEADFEVDHEKLILCIETPEYYPNQLVQVDADQFIANGADAFIAYCGATMNNEPFELLENGWDREKLVMCVETPAYFDNIMLQVDFENFVQFCEQTEIEYCASDDEKIDDNTGKLLMCVESPSYFPNRLIQVNLESALDSFEEAVVDFTVEVNEIIDDNEEEINIDKKPLIIAIGAPEYYSSKIVQIDATQSLENAEISHCEEVTGVEFDDEATQEIELEDQPKETFCVLIETPEYHDNKIVEISSLDDISNADIEFCGDSNEDIQVEEGSQFEFEMKERESLTICVGDKMAEVNRDEFAAGAATTDLEYVSGQFYESFDIGGTTPSKKTKTATTQIEEGLSAHLCYYSDEYKPLEESLVMMVETDEGNRILQVPLSAVDIQEAEVDYYAMSDAHLTGSWVCIASGFPGLIHVVTSFMPLHKPKPVIADSGRPSTPPTDFDGRPSTPPETTITTTIPITIASSPSPTASGRPSTLETEDGSAFSVYGSTRGTDKSNDSWQTTGEHSQPVRFMDSADRGQKAGGRRVAYEPGDEFDVPEHATPNEPGDDIDGDLIEIRLTEPEPTTDDLDSLMNQIDNRVKSFESETTEQIITQIDKIDPTIKREVLSANTNELAKFVDDAPQSSPEPVYTFGAPRTPTFQIRSSPKPSRDVSPAARDAKTGIPIYHSNYSSTREEISDVLSQIDSEMRDALKVFDKKQKPSHYEEANSNSSEDPIEDDPAKIAHKDYAYSFLQRDENNDCENE